MSVVLSEHLPLLASAPDGIQKLRGLILELAVRGKLVPQDLDDEPASELLKRIAVEKTLLAATGEIRKEKASLPLGEDERPFAVPASWEWIRLTEALAVVTDGDHQPPPKADSGVPFLVIGNLNSGLVSFDGCRFVPDHYFEDLDWSKRPTSGDLLYTVTGSFGIAVPVTTNAPFCVQRHVAILKTVRSSPASYLLKYLQSLSAKSFSQEIATGTAQKTVPLSGLRQMPIALPPLAEQHRIVAKVDELMALCDRLEAEQADAAGAHARLVETLLGTLTQSTDAADLATNWQRLAEHFDTLFVTEACVDTLKQTILELAVTGRLLAQNEADRPVSETLNELELAGGNAKVRRGVIAVADSLRYTPPQSLPCNWSAESIARLLQLGAIVDVKDGNHGANHPKVSEFSATGLPFITAAQVSENGTIDYDGAYKVSGAPLEKLRVGFARPGDVIYTHKGSVGRVAICDLDCVLTPQTTYYRLNPSVIHNHFFAYFLRSPSFRNQVDVVKRQTTRDFVSISAQYEFFCHIPPLDEQIRIVQKVDELMALCDRLKADLATARHRQATLADTLIESALDAA